MSFAFILVLFIFWTIFGSFGWVIIERGKDGFAWGAWGEVFGWRSYCPWCEGKLLTRRQLIPLVGRLVQRGKCYRCKLPIPAWYCWIEVIVWVVFVITGLWVVHNQWLLEVLVNGWGELIWRLMVSWLLTLIIIHDLMTQQLNLYAWVLLFVVSSVLIFAMPQIVWFGWFVWALVLVTVFGWIYIGAKRYATHINDGIDTEWFGEGDVMMALLIGVLSGPMIATRWATMSIQMMFVYLILSSTLWIIFFLVMWKKSSWDDKKIPFLPAMIVAWRSIVIAFHFFL